MALQECFLFTVDGNKMILLHGFVKKSQTTPKNEIEVAEQRANAYFREVK